jgi:diadenosine tetraphosphatase ApaH/serine/threonine PP2A family protein phosphatase
MRIGIFSDVHGNLEALQAVLHAYQQVRIDRYACLGDIVGYGANPNECCQLVRDLTDLVIVGNHDAACCGRMSDELFNPAARAAVQQHARMLHPTHKSWLTQLPYRLAFQDLLLCHGSPYQAEQFPYILETADVAEILLHISRRPPLIFVGHTHRGTTFMYREQPSTCIWEDPRAPLTVSPDHGYIFNVGSVGQPRDGDWRSAYAIFDTQTGTFELKRVEYDVDTASEKIERLGLPISLSERLFLGL